MQIFLEAFRGNQPFDDYPFRGIRIFRLGTHTLQTLLNPELLTRIDDSSAGSGAPIRIPEAFSALLSD